jgi:nucleotide-binding universal stress UspA family protein
MSKTFKVLLPVDGSAASLNAVRHVARNLRDLDASVLLLNVQRLYVDAEIAHATRALVEIHRAEGEAALTGAAEILAASGVEYRAEVGFGTPAKVIARTAEEERCDAIVMGTRARSRLMELVAPSVTARVARHSRVPVMSVRHDAPRALPPPVRAPYIAA